MRFRHLQLCALIVFSSCRGESEPSQDPAVKPAQPAVPESPVPSPEAPASPAAETSSDASLAPEPFVAEQCDPTLSGPERAAAAAKRVRPELEQALKEKGLRFGDPVFLRAFKEEGELEMWVRNRANRRYDLFRTWKVAAASGTLGPKLAEGDGQVPEGFYFVPPAALKPDSTFHLAFNIGYPNEYDRAHGRTGTFIMIHGNAVSIGCLAMTDPKIEEIYTLCDAALKGGQPFFRVHVFPFRMTDARLATAAGNRWEDFWKNLREGYDAFEKTGSPPEVTVEKGRYAFK